MSERGGRRGRGRGSSRGRSRGSSRGPSRGRGRGQRGVGARGRLHTGSGGRGGGGDGTGLERGARGGGTRGNRGGDRGRGATGIHGSLSVANSKVHKYVDEEYKIKIDAMIEDFKQSGEAEMRFPSNLNNTERRYVHELSRRLGLTSKSYGKGEGRYLTVRRKVVSKSRNEDGGVPPLTLNDAAKQVLNNFLTQFPPSELELNVLREADLAEVDALFPMEEMEDMDMDVPESLQPIEFETQDWGRYFGKVRKDRMRLPVWEKKNEILSAIAACDVVVITGETGCGKSTQVPQYLMELKGLNYKIVCTQPRRLSAITLAERVAEECGSGRIGDSVGYSIRLDSKRGPNTSLLYCTTGVVLRQVTNSSNAFSDTTHLVIDEVHERDINADFLLTIVREHLLEMKRAGQKTLKLILMSATMQVDAFLQYFRNKAYPLDCAFVKVPGKLYNVHHLFLEDILARTDYIGRLMKRNKRLENALASIAERQETMDLDEKLGLVKEEEEDAGEAEGEKVECQLCNEMFETVTEFAVHAASCTGAASEPTWQSAWVVEDEDDDDDEVDVDDDNEGKKENGADLKEPGKPSSSAEVSSPTILRIATGSDWELLEQYQYSRQLTGLDDDTYVDVGLVVEILQLIEQGADNLGNFFPEFNDDFQKTARGEKGSVLIFLAGWDDISKMIDTLSDHPVFGNTQRFMLLPLHSGVTPASQKKVFQRSPRNVRKIVCSTNIAETSVTIDDVLYVIDAGTSKTKRYDPHSKVSSLTTGIIAKANATQRSGRAGRVRSGICFRLFSQKRFESMLEEEAPEMQRTSLEEVCLQSLVLLDKQTVKISSSSVDQEKVYVRDFLSRAPDPPKDMSVRNALNLLFELGAIDRDERMNPLGIALAALPLDPRLGKMVLIGAILGMKETAVTLAAFASTGRDPFVIPLTGIEKREFEESRKCLIYGVDSDQFASVRAFEEFMRRGFAVCSELFLSPSIMKTVKQTRLQIMRLIPQNLPVVNVAGISKLNTQMIVELLTAIGTFPNVSLLHPNMRTLVSGVESRVAPHRFSVINLNGSKQHVWVAFDEMVRTKVHVNMHQCTRLTPLLVALFRGFYTIDEGDDNASNSCVVHLNEWIEMKCEEASLGLELGLFRARLEAAFKQAFNRNPHLSRLNIATLEQVSKLIIADKINTVVAR